MRAISTLSLEWGTSTFWWRALMALRTRVKKSETGSVKLMLLRLLKSSPVSLQALGSALTSGTQRALSRSPGKCKNQPRRTTNSAIRVPRLRNYRLTEGRVVSYQEDFATPGISPRNASPRKHRRQRPNLRRYARGRPQILQRLCCRVENLGFLFALATCDVLAIISLLLAATSN